MCSDSPALHLIPLFTLLRRLYICAKCEGINGSLVGPMSWMNGIPCRSRGGGTPYNGLYEAASPERGTFFRLQVYERVGKFVFWVCERAQRANR